MSKPIGKIPSNPSPQVQTALDFVEYLAAKDFKSMESILSEDYTQIVRPKSMPLSKRPLNKTESLQVIEAIDSAMKSSHSIPTIEDLVEVGNTVIIHVSSEPAGENIQPGGPESHEFLFWFDVRQEADGKWRVLTFKEFVDSKHMLEFFVGNKVQLPTSLLSTL
ncbi:hypothetical protein C8Q75DRAFT_802700 [Abortiporus biennis]|nr:hypothetical protein C8Q75DRAFT_802700 [Abortiporus biennis]